MYNLFAYTRDPANRIVRFVLDQTVQQAMTSFLDSQVAAFDAECEEIEFDGKYKPDDGERLVISEFDDLDNLSRPINSPLDFPAADPRTLSFDSIKALFFGKSDADGSISVYFQNFDRRRVISSAGFSIFHARDVYKRIEGAGLTLDNKVAAKLNGSKLKFCSFFHVRQIFDMTSYYQEVTDTDIREFARIEQVSVDDLDALIGISDSWIRRKLWLIRESRILERVQVNDIKAIAAEFSIPIVFENVDGEERILTW